jgi:hypothetical protein
MSSLKNELKRYRRRGNTTVTAIPLDLVAKSDKQPGDPLFTYHKWGHIQTAKSGDWLVTNGGDVYTVDRETFENTYTPTGTPGQYMKTGTVWAKRATEPGTIQSKEGLTQYRAGDWLVYNDPRQQDGYAVSADRFFDLYESEE